MNATATLPLATREAFHVSRRLDFFTERELTAQCGHARDEWPQVIVKELIDNALDACEEHGIAPEISLRFGEGSITVVDNGPGIDQDVIAGMADFDARVSSKACYVAADRGAQGNAAKTLFAMPAVLDPGVGHVVIDSLGTATMITIEVDQVAQRPVVRMARKPGVVQIGTSVTVFSP
jgi:DNA topoisomerase VI subunit B